MSQQTEQFNIEEFVITVLRNYILEGTDIVKSLTDGSGISLNYAINDIFITNHFTWQLNRIKRLEELGIDVAKFTFKDGSTLLNAADSEEEIKYLVEKGADVNAKDSFGNGVLAYALQYDECGLETVKYLVEHGAKIDDRNKRGETPLMMIQIGKHSNECLNIVKYLVEKGADIEARDGCSHTFINHLVNLINHDFCIHDAQKTVEEGCRELRPKARVLVEIADYIEAEIQRRNAKRPWQRY